MPMPTDNPLGDLTDFGLSQPSRSDSVGKDNPSVDSLLGSMPEDVRKLVGPAINDQVKAALLEDQLRKEMDTPVKSTKDMLLSPGGIATLLGAGAGAAFGGPAGLAAALGVSIGTVNAAQQKQQMLEAAKQERIKATSEAYDKQQELIEKQRTRLANIFNTNPEAFVGADGQTLAPDAIGWLLTGANISINPMAKATERRRGERWDKQWAFLTETLDNTKTPEDARNVLGVMFGMLQWDNVPNAVTDTLVRTYGTPEFDTNFSSTLLKYGGPTGLSAMRFAAENGLPLTDIEVLRKVEFQGEDSTSPSQRLTQKYVELLDEYNAWAKANPEQYAKIQTEAMSTEEALKTGAEAAFAGRPGDISEFLNRANLPPDVDPTAFMQAYAMIDKEFGLVNTVTGANQVNATQQMTPEEIRNYKANNALQFYQGFQQEAKNSAARRSAAFRNQKRAELVQKIPNAGDATIDALLNLAFEQAAATNPATPDAYMKKVDDLIPKIIKKYNAARGE